MTSGDIQYGVPVRVFAAVAVPVAAQIDCNLFEAPKSPSFTFPLASRRMFAPENKLEEWGLDKLEEWELDKTESWMPKLAVYIGF